LLAARLQRSEGREALAQSIGDISNTRILCIARMSKGSGWTVIGATTLINFGRELTHLYKGN